MSHLGKEKKAEGGRSQAEMGRTVDEAKSPADMQVKLSCERGEKSR